MKYVLTLQFPEKLINFEKIIEIEADLEKVFIDEDIDGHDMGSGEINFFVITNDPVLSFKKAFEYFKEKELYIYLKAAYRDLEGEKYTLLYPSKATSFEIK